MPQPTRDSGFTLIEVLVTISLMGAMMAIAVGGYQRWTEASGQQGTAHELQSKLRQAQQRAVTEGHAMCVSFTDTAYQIWRDGCGAPHDSVDGPNDVNGSDTLLEAPSFTSAAGSVETLTFYPRGTATSGSVDVGRQGSTKTYTLSVEGLTGRVDLDD